MGPLLLTYLLIAADMRTDLSELTFRQVTTDSGVALVGWRNLTKHEENSRKQPTKFAGGRARMLGYMMDGSHPVRDGVLIQTFILMPEAGQLLHPAHRIPDEMVEVWLAGGQSIPFLDRTLVWVEGDLRPVNDGASPGNASYAMKEAAVERAPASDIVRWSAR